MSNATHTLVLTPWMSPHRIVTWQIGIHLVYTKKVDVLESYDEIVSSPSVAFQVPSVVRLHKAISAFKKGVKFSRINVMTRDRWTCQYCGVKLPMSQLNYDHVVPRAQGGRTVWENIVTSCIECNSKKRDRTPQQAGMSLRREPFRPKTLPLGGPTGFFAGAPEVWDFYMGDGKIASVG
jgi:5-methylcytosine-specific restriction endonuclease McrA